MIRGALAYVMLADGRDECRLWTLVSDRLRKAHFLANREVVELSTGNAVAMEVDLAPIGRGDETVIALGNQRRDCAVWRGLM